jgi:hypothetical protein
MVADVAISGLQMKKIAIEPKRWRRRVRSFVPIEALLPGIAGERLLSE